MKRPEIIQAYDRLSSTEPKAGIEQGESGLRRYVENYAVSLPAIVRGFPKGNLDIKALEAHYWDRLKYFYRYEDLHLPVDTKKEAKFINLAIRLIEEWFYKGEWTSCLETPAEPDIRQMLAHGKGGFLEKTRRKPDPNLGRDGKYSEGVSVPNIYDDEASGQNLVQVYNAHAFKFLHSPASVMNTFTKIDTVREIVANDTSFRHLISATSPHARTVLRGWGYQVPEQGARMIIRDNDPNVIDVVNSEERMQSTPWYIKPKQEYKRNLFFMKTSMIAAELIRRTGEGHLTKQGFQDTMAWLRVQIEEEKKRAIEEGRRASDFVPFNFAGQDRSRSSMLHVNTKEFPFALFAVDYLNTARRQKHKN